MVHDTLILTSDRWEATVCPRLGGNVIRLTHNGKDVLRPLTDESQLEEDPFLQGAPILMPANRTYGAAFTFEGVEYRLICNEARSGAHLHGIVHQQPFDVIAQTESSVTLRFTDSAKKTYPFPFSITVTYTLKDGLESVYTIKNLSGKKMPLVFAPHATFPEPDSFSVPVAARQTVNNDRIPDGGYRPLTETEQAYRTGSPSCGRPISGFFRSDGRTAKIDNLRFTVSPEFDHWVLYNRGGNSNLLCVEPQLGAVNGLNFPSGHRVLEIDEELTLQTFLTEEASI